MKKVILTVALAIALFSSSAQTFQAKTSGGGFNVESGVSTDEAIKIGSYTYEVFTTNKGSKYIKLVSTKTGNEYPLWIGEPTKHTFEGQTVYQMQSGSYCIYVIGKSGNPYAKWLDKV